MRRLTIHGLLVVVALLSARGAHAASPADLRIRATMKSFHAGGVGTYNIIVSNRGPGATDDVITVRDQLPAGLNFVSASGQGWTCAASGAVVTCTKAGPLPAASLSLLQLTIGANSSAVGLTVNSITVSYAGDSKPANNTVTKSTVIKASRGPLPPGTATPTPATPAPTSAGATSTPTATGTPIVAVATDLTIINVNQGPFTVGANGTYKLTVTNLGSDTTNAMIAVTDQLPNGLGFVSGTGAGWTCAASNQTVTCTNPGPLADGDSTTIVLTVSVGSAAFPTVSNVAMVSYPADTDTTNDTSTKPTPVHAA